MLRRVRAANVSGGTFVGRATGSGGPGRSDRSDVVHLAWVRLVVANLARASVLSVLALLAWAALPAVLGWHTTTVVSGSMEPRFLVGDIAVSKPFDAHHQAGPALVGRIVLFGDPSHGGRLKFHRLLQVEKDGRLETKGDANPTPDTALISYEQIRGVGILRVPHVGLPVVWARDGNYAAVALAGLGLGLAGALTLLDRPLLRRAAPNDRSGRTIPPRSAGGSGSGGWSRLRSRVALASGLRRQAPRLPFGPGPRIGTHVRWWAVVTALMVLAAVTAGMTPAMAAYMSKTSTPAMTLKTGYYSCSNAYLAQNPSLFWKLNETGTGTVVTDTVGAVTGQYTPTHTPSTSGPCDSGADTTLDGSTQYVAQATGSTAAAGRQTFSEAIWFKTPAAATQPGQLMGFSDQLLGLNLLNLKTDRNLDLNANGSVTFSVTPAAGRQAITSQTGLNDGKWHFVAATLSSSGATLYVDGVNVAGNQNITAAGNYSGYWRVGYGAVLINTTLTAAYFAGDVQNAAVFPTALTSTQVQKMYAARR